MSVERTDGHTEIEEIQAVVLLVGLASFRLCLCVATPYDEDVGDEGTGMTDARTGNFASGLEEGS